MKSRDHFGTPMPLYLSAMELKVRLPNCSDNETPLYPNNFYTNKFRYRDPY
jgi:hypothetical protein